MVAIIVDALRVGAAQLDRGRGGARRQPLAGDAHRRPAGGAAGDRRRRGARHRPRARRGDHALDGRRARSGFAPNPLDGLTFFFEPARPLAATIVDNAEGLSVEAVRADDLRLRRGPARSPAPSSPSPAGPPASRCANTRCRRGERLSAHAHAPAPPARAGRRRRPRADDVLEPSATGSASALAWARGHRCSALIAAAIVALHALPRAPVPAASTLLVSHPQPGLDQTQDRRLPRPDRAAPSC